VGRISKEKNLHLLADSFKRLIGNGENAQLIIVGDGPYLEEMRVELADYPCYFTGYLSGEALAVVYASADIFVFPSTTNTFGNVVLEAQASGLPVIVSDQGDPCENVVENETALICRGVEEQGLYRAIFDLLRDPQRRKKMGQAARHYVEKRSFEAAFLEMWQLYKDPIVKGTAVAAGSH